MLHGMHCKTDHMADQEKTSHATSFGPCNLLFVILHPARTVE